MAWLALPNLIRFTAMLKFLRRLALSVVVLLGLVVLWDVTTYDAPAWQADYRRLKTDMASGYANLDWMAQHRKLDILALDRQTTAAIDGAHSRVRAFLAIRRFIKAFKDPHFRMRVGDRPIVEAAPVVTPAEGDATEEEAFVDSPAGADCTAAGYEDANHAFVFPFARLPGWTPVRDGDFPTALIGDIGVLRIAQFGEDSYFGACEKVFKPGIGEYELKLAVRALQQEKLKQAIGELKSKGATRLLIDISGNGGGTEWVDEVIALMTDHAMSREDARMVGPVCDRSGIWRGEPVCQVLQDAPERIQLQGTGVWTGPVLVLADRGTGSASESMVAWLKLNHVATIIGERTAGAGCGYVNGGTRTQFRASPFDVMMSNCARFLDDGTNEVEGIAPDIEIPMHVEDATQQAAALAAVLAKK